MLEVKWAKIKSYYSTLVSSCIILKHQFIEISPSFFELKYSEVWTNRKVMIPVYIVFL